MCGGGGGGSGGNDWTYWQNIENDRQDRAQRAAQAEALRKADEAAKTRATFLANLEGAVSGATNKAKKHFADLGYTVSDDIINSIISDAKARVPIDDSRPDSYFTSDVFDAGLNKAQDRVRTVNTGKVAAQFAPGFERSYVTDTLDDNILNTILGEQSNTAMTALKYNKDRGVINDAGYNEATSRFNNQSGAARSTLTDIGDSVLGKIRSGVRDIAGEAGTAASSWAFGNPSFDLSPYISRTNDFVNQSKTNLEGKIRSAVGDTQLFDIPSILAAAGTAQGPINLTPQGQDQMVAGLDQSKKRNQRGLGSTGVF